MAILEASSTKCGDSPGPSARRGNRERRFRAGPHQSSRLAQPRRASRIWARLRLDRSGRGRGDRMDRRARARRADSRRRRRRRAHGAAAEDDQRRLHGGRLHARARRDLPAQSSGHARAPDGRARHVGVRRRELLARRVQLQRHRRGRSRRPDGDPQGVRARAAAGRLHAVLDAQPRGAELSRRSVAARAPAEAFGEPVRDRARCGADRVFAAGRRVQLLPQFAFQSRVRRLCDARAPRTSSGYSSCIPISRPSSGSSPTSA